MKKLLYIVAAAFVAVLAFNNISNVETKIIKAMETADVETLVDLFKDEVQLDLPDFDDFANKAQAKTALNKFFSQINPKEFTLMHKGVSKGGNGRYVIGELTTDTTSYRITFYILDELIKEFSVHPIPSLS